MWAANTEPEEYQPHGLINLAPLPVNSAGKTYVSAVDDSLFAEADRRVLVDGNAVYWDSRLLDIADDLNAKDRKSTRLNSSHVASSYAVFCMKKNKNTTVRRS